MSVHNERMNAEFKRAISEALRSIKDPRLSAMTSITEVDVTNDLKHANVSVSIYDTPEAQQETLAVLQRASGLIGREINSRIRIRRIPQFHFQLDQGMEYSAQIDEVLNKIHATDPVDVEKGNDE